jgi:retron-type reverse transcriptase
VDWHSINWNKVYRTVRRLQARIVKAVRAGKGHKVKALVYLLTHSFAGRALAILRVISNAGAKTPGVDGVLWDTPGAKAEAFSALRRHGYQPQPLRRAYIPKSNGKQRALGIPMIRAYCVSSQGGWGFGPRVMSVRPSRTPADTDKRGAGCRHPCSRSSGAQFIAVASG